VDALVTDFAMPGLNGIELIREIRRRKERLPAILVTGYAGAIAADGADGAGGERFVVLQKPIRPLHLAARLRQAMQDA
jgi:CheY-like chemotaxis protein